MRRFFRVLAVAPVLCAAFALQSVSAPAAPTGAGPRVVASEPKAGDKAVDPNVNALKITFSEPMDANEYSLWPIEGRDLPEWAGRPSLSADGLTFTVPMTLRPGRKYGLTVNAPGHMKFKSTVGGFAERFELFFNTADAPAAPAAPRGGGEETTPGVIPAGFHILQPADKSEVRDKVPVVLSTGAVPDGHYVTFFIDDRFIIGMAPDRDKPMMRFTWDTKDKLPMLKLGEGNVQLAAVPKDGEHEIRAELHDAGGNVVQASKISVNLKNEIDMATINNGVQLRYQFEANKDLDYLQTFTCETKSNAPAGGASGGTSSEGSSEGSGSGSGEGAPTAAPTAPSRGKYRGELETQILYEEKSDNGNYALSSRFGLTHLNGKRLAGKDLMAQWGLSNLVRFELDPAGALRVTGGSGNRAFDTVSMLLPLPPNPVRPNESWEAPIILPELLKGKSATTNARNTVEGVEWQGGQETLRIRTDYMVRGYKGVQPSRYLVLASGMKSFPADAQLEIRGRRITNFAYRIGRVMRVAEHKEIRLIIPPAPSGAAGAYPGAPTSYPGPGSSYGSGSSDTGGYPGMPGAAAPTTQRTVFEITADEVTEYTPPQENE